MNKINLLIVENNEQDVHYLKCLLKAHFTDINIVGVASDASSAYNLILETSPNVIILDLELNNDSTGIEVLEMLDGEGDFQFIACSCYKHFAVDCYGHNVIDFLSKPYKLENLLNSIHKAKKQLNLISDYNTSTRATLNKEFAKFLALTSEKEAIVVKPMDIKFFKAKGR